MANEKRLIDANECYWRADEKHAPFYQERASMYHLRNLLEDCPAVDAVEVPDKKLLKAINLLIKQYEHSKNSDYVHDPIAHAFYYTWKQLDDGRRE